MVNVRIIYQDDSLLVLDKPPNLVVDSATTNKEETLADLLQRDFKIKLFRGGIVHRLDKDTSGILLVAKTQPVLENLQSQFKDRKIKKVYLALVHGQVDDSGRVDAAIARNPRNREKFTTISPADPAGREAVTEYEPVERLQFTAGPRRGGLQEVFADFNKIQTRKLEKMNYNQFTLLNCFPKTGRTHQIRVHLKYINHPVVADEKYVGRKMYRLDKRWCPRMFLHAKMIGFFHPVSGKWMELESELAEDLKKVLEIFNF